MAETIGNFKVLAELGKGAHSTIYLVRRESDQRQFALKMVPIADKEQMKYLEQAQLEFRVGQMLNHPNLVKILALETQRDWLFRVRKVHLLIEYVAGKTLDQSIRLSTPWLVQIFAKIAAGLVHMHRRGVYHADLKPNNIILSKAGDVKIIDYGLAWIKGEPKDRVQGTPEYMAPEQSKQTLVNERTDIYNFGATMYRLTTQHLPPSTVAAPNSPAINAKLFRDLLKPVQEYAPRMPKALCELIHHCLEYEPKKRPERVSEVQDELNALVEKLVKSDDDRLEAIGW
ncbi:MAG: serine/threonine protein kinase [Planctomycetes bacterium]|nr:serine/threonine protein kinase [Planctomycetota bacterium]